MTAAPTFSIIMCVYNRAAYVEAAARSVLTQTRRDLELILWNDGSTDGSAEILDRLAATDPRIRVFHEPNRGISKALKLAHAPAQGRYIGWVDSDDLVANTALEECAAVLDSRPVGMVYTDHIVIDAAGRALGIGKRCEIPYSPERLLIDFMTFHFRLVRREVLEKAGGVNDTFATAHDYDFCLRVSEIATIEHLRRPMYLYRVHDGAVSTTKRVEQIESAARAIREALARRGLSQTHELAVEIVGRYTLRPRSTGVPKT
jgi:glycosyltransferase involved in cell wall biosynthesis